MEIQKRTQQNEEPSINMKKRSNQKVRKIYKLSLQNQITRHTTQNNCIDNVQNSKTVLKIHHPRFTMKPIYTSTSKEILIQLQSEI